MKSATYIELGGYQFIEREDWLLWENYCTTKLLCENKILVYMDKDDLFIFEEGESVFKDISLSR